MATSGSIDFLVSRDDIITEALELCGVLGEGEAPNDDQIISTSRTLNMLVKAIQADTNLFAVQRQYMFLQKTQESYSLGSTSSAKVTSSFGSTTINGAVVSGGSTIVVDDASSINASDKIGVCTGTNDVQWTTVNGAPSGSTVTLTDALTADVADGAVVYFYTTQAERPLKVMEAYHHIYSSDTDIPADIMARRDYDTLSLKATTGSIVNQVYYDPQIGTGKLYTWPVATDERDYLILLVQRTLSDLDTGTDDVDYPQEWYLALTYNLAALLCPKYGVPRNKSEEIRATAGSWLSWARTFDEETFTDIMFQPE